MIDKDKYFKEANKLKDRVDMEQLKKLYDIANEENIYNEKNKAHVNDLVESIMKSLFVLPGMQEPLVPWNFWKSEIGKTILQVQFGIHTNDKLYSISDIAKLINVSVSQVRKDISAGKLKGGIHLGIRKKIQIFREKETDEYIRLKLERHK